MDGEGTLHTADAADPWVCSLDDVSDRQLVAGLVALRRLTAWLEAATARVVGEAERRGIPTAAGFASTTSWLISTTGEAPAVCRSRVRTARHLRFMPATRQAFAAGDVDAARVRVLVDARDAAPEVFSEHEEMLVGHARSLSARRFPQAIGRWRRLADHDGSLRDAERSFSRRRLHVSATWAGMVRLDGDLDAESGATVIAALRSLTDPAQIDPEDSRTPAQRRADALVEVCRRHLDASDRATIGGERPHVLVHIDLDALEGRAGRICDVDGGGPITPEAARRLACDASVVRVITDGPSEVLDVGRRTRVVPAGMRRALAIRDGGCTHPGCDVPPEWCDAHHIVHWADGGETTLANLRLLCRRHHRMEHDGTLLAPQLE
jgi:hypothetical protein